jgi:hypothetical protein
MKNLELLKTIYNATISLPVKRRINSECKKSLIIHSYHNSLYYKLEEKVTYFKYELNSNSRSEVNTLIKNAPDMKFRYEIELYKTEPSKFYGFVIKKERYILKLIIYEQTNYNSKLFRNEYFFDSELIKTRLLKDLFDLLTNRNMELINIEKSEMIDLYVNDLSKLVDKSLTREETLNKILEK